MSNLNLRRDKIDKYITESKKSFESLLGHLIEIPTISMDINHKSDMLKGAQLAASYLTEIGGRAQIIETSGHPIIIGYFEFDPKAPTITFYHHLDVQPANPSEWATPPFQFTIKDDLYYFGRGATDNKGPALTALLATRFVVEESIPINIKFIWEMEEEIGSPNFESAIKSHKEDLATDLIIVSDTTWLSREKPSITYGLRGLLAATMTLITGSKDVHSGSVGGAARNPIGELCRLINQCYDPISGRVKIDGFYEKVRHPLPEELKEYEKIGFDVPIFKKNHGLKSLRTEDPSFLLQAIWCRPTFEIHGLVGGYMGEGIKTIVPYKAQAKISTRLVPDQKPEEILDLLKDFVKKQNPQVEIDVESILNPYLGEFSGTYIQAAGQALKEGFDLDPVFIREGGSIGPVITMQNIWSVPMVLLGLSLPEHGLHSPDEYFDWHQASGGTKTFIQYLKLMSQIMARK